MQCYIISWRIPANMQHNPYSVQHNQTFPAPVLVGTWGVELLQESFCLGDTGSSKQTEWVMNKIHKSLMARVQTPEIWEK